MAYGTLTVLDTLASSQQSVAAFGEDNAFAQIEAARQAHNVTWLELAADYAERTSDRLRRFGGPDAMVMDRLDEFGRPDAQKVSAGQNVGFPLWKYGASIQWTRDYFRRTTGQELAAQFTGILDADVKALQRELKIALFRPTNYTFKDRLVDNVDLSIKALINADSSSLPLGPNGETFNGATHTHYLFTAGVAIAAADLTALVETVVEHYGEGSVRININRAQETAVRALTGFTAYQPVQIVPATNAVSTRATLDTTELYNRAIGVYGNQAAEVWVKPWVPAGYLVATLVGGPKPLALRIDPVTGGNLELTADNEQHPLRANSWDRHFGMGVWNRTAAAVLFVDAGAAGAYVQPTIT